MNSFCSDHYPLLLDIVAMVHLGNQTDNFSDFKFEMLSLLEDSFEEEVTNLWNANNHLHVPDCVLTVGK